jgi:hypothetical protein
MLAGACVRGPAAEAATVTGELRTWHAVVLSFEGPETSEDAEPNVFLDYRLTVAFTHEASGASYAVPGYYAADGRAAETGASRGCVWQACFCPDRPGEWSWTASFRRGSDVALSTEADAGEAVSFDGARGSFRIAPTDKTGRDHRAKGMLRYVGERYLRFAATGDRFIKGGADSPENFLGYADFDQTPPKHRYEPHLQDWRPGDPTWRDGRGKGIIGALNYLAGKGMNSVYFLTMNVAGDGKDVWPWTASDERTRFDCSKLAQWDIVFTHMDRLGIMLHVITQEQENDQLLDKGDLGRTRRLYYRELIARFAHHPALVWNMGEENTNTNEQRRAFARYIRLLDPYDHPIVVHTFPGAYERVYQPLLGFEQFEGPSLQMGNMVQTHRETLKWVRRSGEAGRQWFVCLDEIGPAGVGVKPDADDPAHDDVRRHCLWGNLMAGGAGCEWYFGYRHAHNDLRCEDWRSRDAMWDQTRHALQFFHRHLPFWEMKPADDLTSRTDDYCLAKPGSVYAVYLPGPGATELTLPAGCYGISWYDPRRGGDLRTGSLASADGPGDCDIGSPPTDTARDWVALIRRIAD